MLSTGKLRIWWVAWRKTTKPDLVKQQHSVLWIGGQQDKTPVILNLKGIISAEVSQGSRDPHILLACFLSIQSETAGCIPRGTKTSSVINCMN